MKKYYRMKKYVLITVFLMMVINLSAHPWKPSNYIIIDTDGGIDDIRTISMLLSSPDVRVLAISVSPGVLSAENAYIKVKSLLNAYFHEGVPVGINRKAVYRDEKFDLAQNSIWGDEKDIASHEAPDIIPLLNTILTAEDSKIRFVALGSMSTLKMALDELPFLKERLNDIVWSTDGANDTNGFNYNVDKHSSVSMLKKDIPLKIIKPFDTNASPFYSPGFLAALSQIETPYAKMIKRFMTSDETKESSYAFSATDELVAIFLHYPELFTINKTQENISRFTPDNMDKIREGAIKILKGETVDMNQVIKDIPLTGDFYFDDLGPSVKEIVDNYGKDEWLSGVFASEMHRHLGIFEIIGVKMGIRAREYFRTGVDEFSVVSYAGSVPPLSCMNDGLIVSTGATPGHGLIKVSDDIHKRASADFRYMDREIRLTLKPELADKISSELEEIDFIYGLDSDIYWELVREKTIRYWKTLDRHDIFDIEVLTE